MSQKIQKIKKQIASLTVMKAIYDDYISNVPIKDIIKNYHTTSASIYSKVEKYTILNSFFQGLELDPKMIALTGLRRDSTDIREKHMTKKEEALLPQYQIKKEELDLTQLLNTIKEQPKQIHLGPDSEYLSKGSGDDISDMHDSSENIDTSSEEMNEDDEKMIYFND